jgi:hypothetical protein
MPHKPQERTMSLAEHAAALLTSLRASRDLAERKILRATLKRISPNLVVGIRSTVPKEIPEPRKRRRKKRYDYDTQKRIAELQSGTWKSKNSRGYAYNQMIAKQEEAALDAKRVQEGLRDAQESTVAPAPAAINPATFKQPSYRNMLPLPPPKPAPAATQGARLTYAQAHEDGYPTIRMGLNGGSRYKKDGQWIDCAEER